MSETRPDKWTAPHCWTQHFATQVRSLMSHAPDLPPPKADDHSVVWSAGPLTLEIVVPSPSTRGSWMLTDSRDGNVQGGLLAPDVQLTYPTGHTRRMSLSDHPLLMFAMGRLAQAAAQGDAEA